MSGTTPVPKAPEPLLTAQFIVAIYALTILAATMVGVMLVRDLTPLQGAIASSVVTGSLTGVLGFYFGSSKGSQNKDTAIIEKSIPPPGTTTTTVTPTTTTTMGTTLR